MSRHVNLSLTSAWVAAMTDSCLAEVYREQEEQHGRRMAAFHQIRALLAPLVENIIILDRCRHRHRHGLSHSSLSLWSPSPSKSPLMVMVTVTHDVTVSSLPIT